MTGSELRDMLIREIAKASGGGTTRWRKVVSRVKVYPRATHAHCNWEIIAAGSSSDIAVAEKMADRMRPIHPFVDGE